MQNKLFAVRTTSALAVFFLFLYSLYSWEKLLLDSELALNLFRFVYVAETVFYFWATTWKIDT